MEIKELLELLLTAKDDKGHYLHNKYVSTINHLNELLTDLPTITNQMTTYNKEHLSKLKEQEIEN